MTDRPIIFSAPMVRALLAGRKTQTRRLATSPLARCAVGDRLYVREAVGRNMATAGIVFAYRADHGDAGAVHLWDLTTGLLTLDVPRWTPSIHMPRSVSRLTLIVEAVRVEPLQAITLGDICAEGLATTIYDFRPVQSGFGVWADLWDSLHIKPGERWEDNPGVVALTFRVERGNIDRIAA